MDRMSRLLCEKMQTAGCQVAFKSADSKWIFIHSVFDDSDEQRERLKAAGIGVAKFPTCLIYYYLDEWNLNTDEFHAKKQIVKSVPIVVTIDELAVYNLISISVNTKPIFAGAIIDLTDFYGVIYEECIAANKVIIGDHVRFMHYVTAGIVTNADYMMALLWCRSMFRLKLSANEIVFTGEEPISSVGFALCQSSVKILDMSTANLTQCKQFTHFCDCAVDLCEIMSSKVPSNAFTCNSFEDIGLGPEFRASLFGENLEDSIAGSQISIVDTDDFKILMSESYKHFCFDQYPEYEVITFKYRRELDPYVRWYAFLFRKEVAGSKDVAATIKAEFPNIDVETRKKIQALESKLNVFC